MADMVYLEDYYEEMGVEADIMGVNPWNDVSNDMRVYFEEHTIPDARSFFFEDIKEIAKNNELDISLIPYSGDDVKRNTRFFRYLFTYKALEMMYAVISEGMTDQQTVEVSRMITAGDKYNTLLRKLASQGLEYDGDNDGTIDADTSEERRMFTEIRIGRG